VLPKLRKRHCDGWVGGWMGGSLVLALVFLSFTATQLRCCRKQVPGCRSVLRLWAGDRTGAW
jgi:hypothetical protein